MKPGRNDPCPCGSGKKYKQCCQKTEQAQPQDEFLWRRIRRAIEGSPMQILEFSFGHFGREALQEAWIDFMPWEDEEFAMDTPHMLVFMPWFFYEWLPDPDITSVKREALDGRTLGQAYLDKQGKKLDPICIRHIEQCCTAPFSFYDILSVHPGNGFAARDIFTGEETDITEHSASHHMQEGDILFAKVVRIDHVAMLEACAPAVLPPMEKSALLKLRRKMQRRNKTVTPEVLKEYMYEILDIYLDAIDRLFNPPMPQLQNTDGDPLLPHRLVYEIESPRAAFDALSKLCLTDSAEDLLADGEFDTNGELTKIEFTWQKRGNKRNKSWDNTILGHIKIDGQKMNVEVNSENRAQKIRALIEEMLPGARYKTTVIESLQAMLAQAEEEGETASSRRHQKEIDELNSRPEVQAEIAKYLRQHYRTWPETKLPALNGKTPLQAVKTRDGREMVEALLLDIQRESDHTNMPFDPAIIAELRGKLGLIRQPSSINTRRTGILMNEPITLPVYTAEELAKLSPAKLTDIIIEDEDRTPRNVIDECAARGDAMTEYLQQLHEDDFLWRLDDDLDDDSVWWLRLHAVMILGLIPSERAGLLLVELMRRMSLEDDSDVQGWLAGYWPAQFHNKPESVLPALQELSRDADLDWYIRIQAIDAFVARTAQQGDEACNQALAWLAGIVADENEDWTLRLSAGNSLLDYAHPEYRELLEDMAKRQGFMGVHFALDDVQKAYADTHLVPEWKQTRFQNPWGFYEEKAITQRQLRWQEERIGSSSDDDEDDFDDFDFPEFENSEPYVRPEPKIGRNDPCPCGSGKKYKKCCLAQE